MTQHCYDLSNHELRGKALESFFAVNGIRRNFARIANQGDWFALELVRSDLEVNSPEFQQLVGKINQTCGTNLPLQIISLQKALADLIQKAGTDNEADQTACAVLLNTLFEFDFVNFDLESGQLTVSSRSPTIAGLYTRLEHPHLAVSSTQLGIKLYELISALQPSIFLVHKGHGEAPIIFLNNHFLPKNRLLLSKEHQEDGSIKVTPYMIAEQPTIPANYHFILDRSESMLGERIETAKNSLLNFAQILFQFEPRAKLFINLFDSNYKPLSPTPFEATDLCNGRLASAIRTITGGSSTNIAKACLQKIREFADDQNNVLLFTDGEDTDRDHQALSQELDSLSPEKTVRNKFFIISFLQQPHVLQKMTQIFGSQLIVETTAALQDVMARHDQLQNWAACRELFTTRVLVQQKIDKSTTEVVSKKSMTQSNQLEALESITVQPGDEIEIEITDSSGRVLFTTREIIDHQLATENFLEQNRGILSPGANSVFHHTPTAPVEQSREIKTPIILCAIS